MDKVIHRSDSRGIAEHGWLSSRHTFSFANYYRPDRMGFGKIRVFNDDVVKPAMGFDTHSHNNMEIVSLPLSGSLRHRDSMGNQHIIQAGEVQIISAGLGITHSEYNNSLTEDVNFLQIWILSKKLDIEPRYEQKKINMDGKNAFVDIVSPHQNGPENSNAVWINQDAYFSLAIMDAGGSADYKNRVAASGVYLFVLSGEVAVSGDVLYKRDGMAISGMTGMSDITISAHDESKILCIESTLS